jgi:hypothetical protein
MLGKFKKITSSGIEPKRNIFIATNITVTVIPKLLNPLPLLMENDKRSNKKSCQTV